MTDKAIFKSSRPPLTTGDWAGGPPQTRLWTGKVRPGHHRWGTRRVRADGTVRWYGHTFRPKADVQIMPIPGEILLFYDFGEPENERRAGMGRGRICEEWSSPPDPDGYIRRIDWVEAEMNARRQDV